jgi:peroxiredoxin
MVEKEGLEFPVLVEADLQATQAYGILNQKSPKVPHPTVLVIDREGIVRFFHLDENYRRRPKPEVILEALRDLRPAADAP